MPEIISLVLVGFTFLCNFNEMPEIISLVLVGFTFLCNFNGMPEIIPGFSGVHVFM
jgi:hypothetical protein